MAESETESSFVRARDPSLRPSRPAPPSADYNLRILWPLARWSRRSRARRALAGRGGGHGRSRRRISTARAGGSRREAFEADPRAVPGRSWRTTGRSSGRARHRMQEAYGPLRYVLWAASPGGGLRASGQARTDSCRRRQALDHRRRGARASHVARRADGQAHQPADLPDFGRPRARRCPRCGACRPRSLREDRVHRARRRGRARCTTAGTRRGAGFRSCWAG